MRTNLRETPTPQQLPRRSAYAPGGISPTSITPRGCCRQTTETPGRADWRGRLQRPCPSHSALPTSALIRRSLRCRSPRRRDRARSGHAVQRVTESALRISPEGAEASSNSYGSISYRTAIAANRFPSSVSSRRRKRAGTAGRPILTSALKL